MCGLFTKSPYSSHSHRLMAVALVRYEQAMRTSFTCKLHSGELLRTVELLMFFLVGRRRHPHARNPSNLTARRLRLASRLRV